MSTKTFEFKSKRLGFALTTPAGWSRPRMANLISLLAPSEPPASPFNQVPQPIVLSGPNGESLNILVTPLTEAQSDLSRDEAEGYFDEFCHRHDLEPMGSGVIQVAGKEHFWAMYYKMSLMGTPQFMIIKKYSLVFNRVEYLMTAGIAYAAAGGKLPDNQAIEERVKVYDGVVLSFRLLGA